MMHFTELTMRAMQLMNRCLKKIYLKKILLKK